MKGSCLHSALQFSKVQLVNMSCDTSDYEPSVSDLSEGLRGKPYRLNTNKSDMC